MPAKSAERSLATTGTARGLDFLGLFAAVSIERDLTSVPI
jgi:hypothetical protein